MRLPVFWIGGRSGCGKSVALLHQLARIHAQGNTHVFWIGSNVSALPEAIRLSTALRTQGRDAIVAVDDPYAPATQDDDKVWKDAIASLESIRCQGEYAGLPVLLCCGPTEHAQKLHHAHPDEVIVNTIQLPEEQQSDLQELRLWYRQRTGNDAPDVGDENVLLVQLFFQWHSKATLSEFATRFQKRINEADPAGKLYEIFSLVLAANRLYIGYPQIAFEKNLPSSLRDAVAQLKKEHHIADMSMGRDGVWLAHPHLSNAIYEWWYHPAESKRYARESHLNKLISDALLYGESPRERTAPLWAVSRATTGLSEDEPAVGRLDIETISNVISNTYQQRIEESNGQLPTSELPAWIQIRATFPTISLSIDPFDLAINKIKTGNISETGLRLTCHKLLQFKSSMSMEQVSAFLSNFTALLKTTMYSWFEWPHVAVDGYNRTSDKTIEALLIEWIKSNCKKHIAHRILLDLLYAECQGSAVDEGVHYRW